MGGEKRQTVGQLLQCDPLFTPICVYNWLKTERRNSLRRLLLHLTLYWCHGGLCEANVVFRNVERRLMLGDLHARAHVALAMEEEGEGARQALAGDRGQRRLRVHRRRETALYSLSLCLPWSRCYFVWFNRMDPLTGLNWDLNGIPIASKDKPINLWYWQKQMSENNTPGMTDEHNLAI